MKKRILLTAAAFIIGIFIAAAFILPDEAPIIERTVTVTDGAAAPASDSAEFEIDEQSEKTFFIEWEVPAPGLLSGIRVLGPKGERIFACTGDTAKIESNGFDLAPGTYTFEVCYLANEEAFARFLNDNGLGQPTEQYDFADSGEFEMQYSFDAVNKTAYGAGYIVGICTAVVLIVLLVAILTILSKKNPKEKHKFDERQELVRGRGFKYGFFTNMIAAGLLFVLNSLDIPPAADAFIVAAACVFPGVLVFAAYCIWNDGYFSLNENHTTLMIIFAFIGAINILSGVMNLLHGNVIENGQLGVGIINFVCAAMFMVIFAVLLAKKIKDGKEDRA